jgi:hypothetical protein
MLGETGLIAPSGPLLAGPCTLPVGGEGNLVDCPVVVLGRLPGTLVSTGGGEAGLPNSARDAAPVAGDGRCMTGSGHELLRGNSGISPPSGESLRLEG